MVQLDALAPQQDEQPPIAEPTPLKRQLFQPRPHGGNDAPDGGAGADTLDGGAGDDTLEGGAGDDTFLVDSVDDVVIEAFGGGNADRVKASVSYALGAGVHVEFLTTTLDTATLAIDLTGNALSQEITGNAGNNTLHDGGIGASDHLRGLGGDDTYRVFNAGTTIAEDATQGTNDKVITAVSYVLGAGVHVETLQTNSGAGTSSIDLTGNEIAQTIIGNAGANVIDGGLGNDILQGLGGNDTFLFSTAPGAGNIDTILDFNPADDQFLLSNAIFTALTPGTLSAASFVANTTGLAEDALDRIIYETDTGAVFHDPDGLGGAAAVQFAVVVTTLAITGADFSVA